MNNLYKVLVQFTEGWSQLEATDRKLTKEESLERIKNLLNEGYSPDRIRAVFDND
jgi:hypothetical protein